MYQTLSEAENARSEKPAELLRVNQNAEEEEQQLKSVVQDGKTCWRKCRCMYKEFFGRLPPSRRETSMEMMMTGGNDKSDCVIQ